MPVFQQGGQQTFGIQNNQTPAPQTGSQGAARQQPQAQQNQPQLQSQQPPAQSNYYGQGSSAPNQQPQVNNTTYSQNSVYSQPQGVQRPQVQSYTGNNGMGQPQYGGGQTYGTSSAPPPASSGTSQNFQPQYGGGQNVGMTNPPAATQNFQAQNGSGQTIGPTSGNSPMGWSNWTPNNGTQNGQQWQPTAAPAPVQAGLRPSVARPVSAAPAQSIENQALGGAGASASQTQSFLSALNQAGAGSNNTFMNQAPAAQAAVSPLLGPLATSSQAAPTYSYNQGLGASGATNVFGALNPATGQNFNPNGVTADGTYGQSSGSSPGPSSTLPYTMPSNYFANGSPFPPSGTAPSSQPQIGSQQTFGIQTPLTSDERAKTGIAPDRKDTKDFLDSLKAYQYEYKDQKHGEGPQWSVMAQDLEKTPVGKSAVINTPEGKKVNYARLEAVHLASTAMLNERITKLESKLRKASIGKKGK